LQVQMPRHYETGDAGEIHPSAVACAVRACAGDPDDPVDQPQYLQLTRAERQEIYDALYSPTSGGAAVELAAQRSLKDQLADAKKLYQEANENDADNTAELFKKYRELKKELKKAEADERAVDVRAAAASPAAAARDVDQVRAIKYFPGSNKTLRDEKRKQVSRAEQQPKPLTYSRSLENVDRVRLKRRAATRDDKTKSSWFREFLDPSAAGFKYVHSAARSEAVGSLVAEGYSLEAAVKTVAAAVEELMGEMLMKEEKEAAAAAALLGNEAFCSLRRRAAAAAVAQPVAQPATQPVAQPAPLQTLRTDRSDFEAPEASRGAAPPTALGAGRPEHGRRRDVQGPLRRAAGLAARRTFAAPVAGGRLGAAGGRCSGAG
jgi:hypothetical protein